MKTIFFSFSLVTGICSLLLGQSNNTLEDLYRDNIPLFQDIVSGGYYAEPSKGIEGHPYFESRNLEKSALTINGLSYQNVPLSYNIFTDELITFQPVHRQKILIRPDKINHFELYVGKIHNFILLPKNPGYLHHRNGIYELLESGSAQLLCKHYKLTKAKREVGIYTAEFIQKADYFLQKNNEIQQIKTRKQAYVFLNLDKKSLRSRLKEQGIRFRSHPVEFLTLLTRTHNEQLIRP